MAETLEERKKRHHQEDLQRLRGFRPIDDTFMRCLFRNNVPLAEMVLRIITGKTDLQLVSCETQADLKRVTGAKSTLLDAYGTDSMGKKYDIEVQKADIGADPHRARYLKGNPKGVSEVCKQMEDLRNESILEGIDIGDLRTTVKYYKKGKITLEEAAEDLNMTVEEFKEKMNQIPAEAV